MLSSLQPFFSQPLRRVIYYRPQCDANEDLNWLGFHDVGQGVELAFDAGHFFITWDTAAEKGITVQIGRMVDWLRGGAFENVSEHPDWQALIGQPFESLEIPMSEIVLQIGQHTVYIVTAEIDRQNPEIIDGMADNLVVFFTQERRDSFFAQYRNE